MLFSCPVLSDSLRPHDCSTPGLPVCHHLPKFAQVHVHCIGDAIQPSFLLPSVFPSIRVFSKKSVLHIRWPQYWNFGFSISPFNEYSRLILTGLISLQSRDSQESPTPQFKSITSLVFIFLYGPILNTHT